MGPSRAAGSISDSVDLRLIRHVIGTIRQTGAVLVTHGDMFMGRAKPDVEMLGAWEQLFPRATAQTLVAFDSAPRVATLRLGRDSAVFTVDVAVRLAGVPVSAFSVYVHSRISARVTWPTL